MAFKYSVFLIYVYYNKAAARSFINGKIENCLIFWATWYLQQFSTTEKKNNLGFGMCSVKEHLVSM